MATPPNKVTVTANVAAPEPAAAPVAEAPPARRFATTTEDAPSIPAPQATKRGLNPKTIAEQKAGRERIAAYTPVSG
ncbi:hypothetical protein [Bradyrhizobium cenepequi]